jgi:poly-gamma-glutamate capsule biosynthesis protein CapA/YwtB (metallophosphatase superfamily)
MRAVEVYNNRFIAYSLGNFCTPYNVNLTGISGHAPLMVVTIGDDGAFIKGDVHPMIQTRGIGPRHDKTGSVIRQLKMLSESDIPHSQAVIDEKGHIRMKK